MKKDIYEETSPVPRPGFELYQRRAIHPHDSFATVVLGHTWPFIYVPIREHNDKPLDS